MAACGDSGSPVVQVRDGKEVVVGIHQASCEEMSDKCSEESPGQVADVGKFRLDAEKKKRELWENFKDMAWKGGASAVTGIISSYLFG